MVFRPIAGRSIWVVYQYFLGQYIILLAILFGDAGPSYGREYPQTDSSNSTMSSRNGEVGSSVMDLA